MAGSFENIKVSEIPYACGDVLRPYVDNFDALADLIASYSLITRTTHFVLVPGPLDVTVNSVLPRKQLLPSFLSRMRNRVPNVHFATNPCRIKFFEQEIVIFREDLMSRMLRNLVGVKPDVKNDDLKRYVSSLLTERGIKLNGIANAAGADYFGPKPPHAGYDIDTTHALRL